MSTRIEKRVRKAWKFIEDWFAREVPQFLPFLNAGATEEQIHAAERILGVTFPEDVRISYTIHNGETPQPGVILNGSGIFESDAFFSLEAMVEDWRMWNKLLSEGTFEHSEAVGYDGVKSDWWNPAWIPITHSAAGHYQCLDFDPAPGGYVGQIMSFYCNEVERGRDFDSFVEMLEDFVAKLEDEEIIYSEEYGCLAHIHDISE
jgi:cell wall assembly regulator SMI1